METSNDRPPRPTSLDIMIGYNLGSTVALEATSTQLQASKQTPKPNKLEEIERLTRENGNLRQELAYYHKLQEASLQLAEDTRDAMNKLRQAVFEFRNIQKEVDNSFHKDTSI